MTDRWPEEGLERCPACPVCGDERREPLYEGLRDRFGNAPGTWTLHRCLGCGSAFLDPRPTEATIGLAYHDDYYTHAEVPDPSLPLAGVRRALANGYLNAKYGSQLTPAIPFGRWILPLFPVRRARTDRLVYHLQRVRADASVLDVGCGNGAFLQRIEAAGWRAVGIDPDPAAVETCTSLGLQAHVGTLDTVDLPEASFDAVTLAAVLEHVHDQRQTLQRARRLLRPAGTLWLATPNLASAVHERFGRHWLQLDPPRHLVLFNPASVRRLVEETGFRIVAQPAVPTTRARHAESALLAGGWGTLGPARALVADVCELLRPSRAQDIILVATAA